MERILAVLVSRLEQTFKDQLVSVTLYGSAATGDFHGRYSDINVLCILTGVGVDELARSEPIFRWWRECGYPAPLLMSEPEVAASADSFGIEFSDMRERRKVLSGRDVVAGLQVDPRSYRTQVEHELRAGLLRLRQHAAGALNDRDRLLKLCLDSFSAFCVLGRHAMLLAALPVGWSKREIVQGMSGTIGADMAAFAVLADIREERVAPQEVDPVTLFGKYLSAVQALIAYVDGLEKGAQ